MTYSQGLEQETILNHMKDFKGTLLSIGENDGETLSNVRQLILNGYAAVLVEPAETPFAKLKELYKDNPNVECLNVAISDTEGMVTFYESGEHLGKGDSGLLSTLVPEEMKRWNDDFKQTITRSIKMDTLLDISPYKTFDLISIDAEGKDYEILSQIDLTGCKLLIVETNSIEDKKYIDYCKNFGMRLVFKNAENLIFVK